MERWSPGIEVPGAAEGAPGNADAGAVASLPVSESQGQSEVREPFVSRAAGIRVREADLGARAMIGSGAATEVHRLDSFTVPGHLGGLAFVRVRDRAAAHWDSAVLSRLVALRWELDAGERAVLDGAAAWPLAVVEDDEGEVVGCLLPLAAHPFYYVPIDDAPADGRGQTKAPQQAKWLVVAPKRARRAGAAAVGERDVVTRATVLARVSLLLAMLHRHGVVFGDLSDRSVLFGVGEVAEAFVVGCEWAAFAGEGSLQRNSAGWAAPEPEVGVGGSDEDDGDGGLNDGGDGSNGDDDGGEGEKHDGVVHGQSDDRTDPAMSTAATVQSVATDLYKLGLLVLRVLAPAGDGLERSRDADRIRTVLDDTGRRMLHDALGDDPGARPTAGEWYRYLRGVIIENLSAPEIRSVVVSPALVAEGDEVRLDVELSGARQLTIQLPGRADITREVGGRVVSERFTARQSGRIGVRASNDHGDAAALSNTVRVLPVPTPGRISVESPDLDGMRGLLPDLGPLEAAVGIASEAAADGSPFTRVAALQARIDVDSQPLNDVLRIGLEAERVSRERMFPSFEEFLGGIASAKPRGD